MYNLWSKLTTIEDVLLGGDADEVKDYLRTNYFTPIQQIHAMISERAAQIKRNSLQDQSTTNSPSRFRLRLVENDFSFDPVCTYIGFILHSYDGKSEFTLNGQQYQRGDIFIKPIVDKTSTRNQEDYLNLCKSLLFNSIFLKKIPSARLEGLGIIYEQYKWNFDAFIIGSGSKLKQSLFSLDEQILIEMYVLSWTKNMHDKVSIRQDARQMLYEQLDYVKELLETHRDDIKKIWTLNEVEIAIKTFVYESQHEIDALQFQVSNSLFNTFTNVRDEVQFKHENRLNIIADIFEHHQLTIEEAQQPSLYEVWKQLKMVENWLHKKDFDSLANFLNSNMFYSIESLFANPVPLFLNQLGICSESDTFDPTLNYVGLLIYLYNDQEEFTLNKHQCKRGQILIRQKEKFCQFVQAPTHRKISFEPLFIHEFLYEWYFKEKPNERFHGIGFIYEQNQWKFDIITYAGKYGIYSKYDDNNPMKPNSEEQHALDLILSSIYIHNKWKNEAGRMYTIKDLQSIGRVPFQKQTEIIEELFQMKENTNTCQLPMENFLDQYRPKVT